MTFRDFDALVFLALGAAVLGLDLAGRRNPRIPTLRHLFGSAMGRVTGRAVTWLAWWWLGWHFFVR